MGDTKAVAVLGASGYAGAELLRLLAAHPQFEVVAATASSHEGMAVADLQPALAAAYPGLRFGALRGGRRRRGGRRVSAPFRTEPRSSWSPSCSKR